MTPEMMAQILEYFDLKQFLHNNSLLRLAIILGIMILLWIAVRFITLFFEKKLEHFLASKPKPTTKDGKPLDRMDVELFEKVIHNARRICNLGIIYWGMSRLVIGPLYADVIHIIFVALCIWAAIEFFVAFVPFNLDLYFRRQGVTLQTSKSRSLMPIIKGVIWAVGLTFLLDNLGFHVSTIIAGLGIVGVAVGLAGQAILADFFSYIVILLDKPFGIGDFVVLGDGKAGDVEYMGPKTTHLRSLEDDLIVCANSEMTKGVLVNQGSIREREVLLSFGVAYETPVETLKRMPDLLREIIESYPNCKFDRACLLSFGSSNLQYQVLYFIDEPREEIRTYMNTRSQINIAILEKFNKEGISMAYPTEHVLFTNLNPAEPKKAS